MTLRDDVGAVIDEGMLGLCQSPYRFTSAQVTLYAEKDIYRLKGKSRCRLSFILIGFIREKVYKQNGLYDRFPWAGVASIEPLTT